MARDRRVKMTTPGPTIVHHYSIDVLKSLKDDFENPTSSYAYELFISNLLKPEVYRNALKKHL